MPDPEQIIIQVHQESPGQQVEQRWQIWFSFVTSKNGQWPTGGGRNATIIVNGDTGSLMQDEGSVPSTRALTESEWNLVAEWKAGLKKGKLFQAQEPQ